MKWDMCNNLKGCLGLCCFLNSVSRRKSIKIKFRPTKCKGKFFPYLPFIYSIICFYQDELLSLPFRKFCLMPSALSVISSIPFHSEMSAFRRRIL